MSIFSKTNLNLKNSGVPFFFCCNKSANIIQTVKQMFILTGNTDLASVILKANVQVNRFTVSVVSVYDFNPTFNLPNWISQQLHFHTETVTYSINVKIANIRLRRYCLTHLIGRNKAINTELVIRVWPERRAARQTSRSGNLWNDK